MNKKIIDDTSNKLFYLIPKLKKKIFSPHRLSKDSHLPSSHFHVIMYLHKNGPTSVSDIANFLGISRPNMTPIINNLISDELVERVPDPKDRRIIRIVLTNKANDFFDRQREKIKATFSEKISVLTEEDLIELNSSLDKITDIIEKID